MVYKKNIYHLQTFCRSFQLIWHQLYQKKLLQICVLAQHADELTNLQVWEKIMLFSKTNRLVSNYLEKLYTQVTWSFPQAKHFLCGIQLVDLWPKIGRGLKYVHLPENFKLKSHWTSILMWRGNSRLQGLVCETTAWNYASKMRFWICGVFFCFTLLSITSIIHYIRLNFGKPHLA